MKILALAIVLCCISQALSQFNLCCKSLTMLEYLCYQLYSSVWNQLVRQCVFIYYQIHFHHMIDIIYFYSTKLQKFCKKSTCLCFRSESLQHSLDANAVSNVVQSVYSMCCK